MAEQNNFFSRLFEMNGSIIHHMLSRAIGARIFCLALILFVLPAPGGTVPAPGRTVPALSGTPSGAGKGVDEPNRRVLDLAHKAAAAAYVRGHGTKNTLLTIIDYSLPSTEKRLWVMDGAKIVFHELVAHGKRTGENRAEKFSNTQGKLMSSIGLYETASTYQGKHGYSLKLIGLEKGWNDNALDRKIVIHGARYVSEEFAQKRGQLGRSWGCPALDEDVSMRVIDAIKDGALIFIYFPDKKWIKESIYLK